MANQQELLALERRKKMAEAMLGQGTDTSPVQHPLQAIARVFQAYIADKEMKDADQGIKEYDTGLQADTNQRIGQYMQQMQGQPEIPQPAPELGGGPGLPAVPPDRNKALATLMGARDPMLQRTGMGLALQQPKADEPFTLKPGETRFGPGNKPVASLPAETKPEGPKKGQLRTLTRGLDEEQQEYDGQQWVKVGAGPRFNPKAGTTVNVNGPKENFRNEKTLRDEFTDASKPFVKIRDAFSQVKDALGGEVSAPATLAGATKFMKMLDPESVVRESELNMALKSTGMLDRFMNIHNTIAKGQVLTPKQVQEIQRIAGVLYQTAEGQQTRVTDYYNKLATDYELDPSRVVRDLSPAKSAKGGLSAAEQAELAELRKRFRK